MRQLSPLSLRKTTKLGQPRRRVKPMWRRPALISSMLILISIGAGGGAGWWIWHAVSFQDWVGKAKWKFIAGSAKNGFSVREIFVQGRIQTNKDTLLQALRLSRGAPILTFNPEEALARVTALPWIDTAVIERALPDVVYLFLVERRPLALWQHKGRFSLIDTRGGIIPLLDVGRFSNLIIVVGRDAPKHASKLLDTLALAPELAKRVKSAVWVGGRRWDIQMDNDVEVLLPESEAIAAWVQLAEMQEQHRFLEKDVATVDLRLPDRIILRQLPAKEEINWSNPQSISNPSNFISRRDV